MDYVSPWFQAALLPKRWDVAGISCPSLSVWHLFALEQMGNAYARSAAPTFDDAVGLLVVATSSREELREMMARPRLMARKLARMARRLARVPFDELDNCVVDYFVSCIRSPDHKHPTDGGSRGVAAPYQWHIVLCLCDHYGMTPEEAWAMPYAEARCMFDTYAETQGDKTLADPKLQRAIDEWQPGEGGR